MATINQQHAVDAAWDTLAEMALVKMSRTGEPNETPEWWIGRLEGALVPVLDSLRPVVVPALVQ